MRPTPRIQGLADRVASDLTEFCVRHQVRTLRLYGSFVRGELTPESDIDVLLEFQAGVDPDLFELGGMQQDLTEIFGREADLKTPEMFTPRNLQRVLDSSVVGYAA